VIQRLLVGSIVCLGLSIAQAPAHADAPTDSTTQDWSQVPEYRIVPSDRLAVNFGAPPGETDDLIRLTTVRPDGRISVFPVGELVAAGRTIRDVESSIVTMLSAEMREPRVTVTLVEAAGNQVHVIGRVEHSGSFPCGPFTTVVQAITLAGGFSADAARISVLVFHRDGAHTVKVMRLAIDRTLKQGTLADDLVLSRFDIVFVPRSTIGNINVFTRQFFTEQLGALQFMLIGWELLNLDRISIVR
jgi:polysaccharide export outer membrane protein